MRRTWAIRALVLLAVIGLTGTAGAQSGAPTTTAPATAKPSDDGWVRNALKPLVDNNTLTQEQLDAVVKALQDARPTPNAIPPGAGPLGKGGPPRGAFKPGPG